MEYIEKRFLQIAQEQKGTIYTVCYMFSKDEDEVNDLFQEVLINIWNGLENFEERSNIKTWVYRISLNTCISYDRKKKKRKDSIPLTMDVDFFDNKNENTQQVSMLHERISKLQPFDRAIILLWLENIPYEEIGKIVGISTKNVTVRMFRIREQLKKMSNNE